MADGSPVPTDRNAHKYDYLFGYLSSETQADIATVLSIDGIAATVASLRELLRELDRNRLFVGWRYAYEEVEKNRSLTFLPSATVDVIRAVHSSIRRAHPEYRDEFSQEIE